MTSDHDRIDPDAHIDTTVDEASTLVGEPGWFINNRPLTRHRVDRVLPWVFVSKW